MGTWGTALYSDDLAADLRGEFRDLLGQGMSSDAAVEDLVARYAPSLRDPDEAPVFWLVLAHTAWRLGRPSGRATAEAFRVISSGSDLARWPDAKGRQKRQLVLARVETDLRSDPPPPKRIPARAVANNAWTVGEVLAFRLASGTWTLFRVIGHQVDKGGRHAICEPLNWLGPAPPEGNIVADLPLRPAVPPWQFTQFLLGEPRRKQDAARIIRTGTTSRPLQQPAGCAVLVFPHLDRQLDEIFGLR